MSRLTALAFAALMATAAPAMAADGYTVAHGATSSITEHGVCRSVTNNSGTGLGVFVPTKSPAEWSSFYGSPPAGVGVAACVSSGTWQTRGIHNGSVCVVGTCDCAGYVEVDIYDTFYADGGLGQPCSPTGRCVDSGMSEGSMQFWNVCM